MAHDAQEAEQELKSLFGGCDVHREAEGCLLSSGKMEVTASCI